MLKSLAIKNLILIESCFIELKPGLNILTGETGTGKTAFTQAISFALGQRADSSVIRQGQNKALIEACFETKHLPLIGKLLDESGIEFTAGEDLIIRRELSKDGKSRAFINDQLTTLPLLQEIGSYLIDVIGQHSYHELKQASFSRELLDQYGNLSSIATAYTQSFHKVLTLTEKLEGLIRQEAERERELDLYKFHLKELEDAPLSQNEEEDLFEEYKRLAHHKEIAEALLQLESYLASPERGILQGLKKSGKSLSSLAIKEPKLEESSNLIQQSIVSLQEGIRQISLLSSNIEFEPHHFLALEKRLSTIEKLKRKYGKSSEEMQLYKVQTEEKIRYLENLEAEIDNLTSGLKEQEVSVENLANDLSQKRKETADKLGKILTRILRELNMPSAQVEFHIENQQKNAYGKDLISLWIKTNQGEPLSLVKETSSGGELSRLLLAIKIALFQQNLARTIIFDEIDANVGGETASLIAEKLAHLGTSRQVICITHFPQVACRADHHFRAKKQEINGRTLTLIEALDPQGKEEELLRMVGGKKDVFNNL